MVLYKTNRKRSKFIKVYNSNSCIIMRKKLHLISVFLRYKFIIILIKIITPNLYYKLKIMEYFKTKISKIPRPFTLVLKKYFLNTKIIGAEIGVQKGRNALSLLKELNIKKLYLIDIWKKDSYYRIMLNKMKNNKKIKIIKNFSHIAINEFKNNSLDFIYIDANHNYSSIYQDIELWYKKVKINGIIGGHDIYNTIDVLRAVKDYSLLNNIMYYLKPPDWFFVKSKKNNY